MKTFLAALFAVSLFTSIAVAGTYDVVTAERLQMKYGRVLGVPSGTTAASTPAASNTPQSSGTDREARFQMKYGRSTPLVEEQNSLGAANRAERESCETAGGSDRFISTSPDNSGNAERLRMKYGRDILR